MDISSPDELFTHQTDTITGQTGIFLSQFRIAQIHINFSASRREVFSNRYSSACLIFFFSFFNNAFINYAMSSIDSYINTVRNSNSSSFTTALSTNDTGNTQLTANNGSMTGHSAAVSDDSFGFFHCRYPVRSGHLSNKDLSFFKFIDAGRIKNNVYAARNFTRACRQTFHDNFMISSSHRFAFLHFCSSFFIAAAPYGFRTGLQNPDFIGTFINAPFHIHIAAIMFFDLFSIISQFQNLLVSQSLYFAQFFRDLHFFTVAAFFAYKHDVLLIYAAVNDFVVMFGNSIIIRSNSTLNNIFTQSKGCLNQDIIVIASSNVNSKHNTGSFRENHHLYNGTQSNFYMIKALFFTIINSTVGKAGSVAFLYLCDNGFSTLYVQIGILLTSKACIR